MRPQGLSGFWSRFLDSRAPIWFITGSTALAVLSNAIYDIAKQALRDRPVLLLLIAAVAVGLISISYVAFVRLARRLLTPAPVAIATEVEVQPQPSLVVLVSAQPNGPEEAAIRHHQPGAILRHCWLIASRSVVNNGKAADLQFWLAEQDVRGHVVPISDANQAFEAFSGVQEALRQARALLGDEIPIIVDITGGTKPMSAGAAFACQAAPVPMQYMVTPRDEQGAIAGPAQAMQVRIEQVVANKEKP